MSRTTLSPAWKALCRRALHESIHRPVKPSDRRRLQSAADSSEDDVPTPEEIDPTVYDYLDCDFDADLDAYGRDLDTLGRAIDDDQPYADAP